MITKIDSLDDGLSRTPILGYEFYLRHSSFKKFDCFVITWEAETTPCGFVVRESDGKMGHMEVK